MKKLKGIIVPMVTPLNEDNSIDFAATDKLVEHLYRGGVHGIFVLGTTGEAQSLSFAQRKEFIIYVGKLLGGRLPYIAGISDTSYEDALELASAAEQSGACGVVSTVPYYFEPSQREIENWYRKLADNSALPVYIYNMPSHVKASIAPETVAALASHPNIRGFKDSSHNMTYFQTVSYLTRGESDFSLFVGPEEQTAQAVLMGAAGGVNGGANMFPELYVGMYEAALSGNLDRVRLLQASIMEISSKVYSVGGYLPGLKCAMEYMGICKRWLSSVYSSMSEEGVEKMKKCLAGIAVSDWK